MHRLAPSLLLAITACSAPREQPWFAELLFLAAFDVKYDEDGMLHVLYAESDGWHVGTLDPRAGERAVGGGPVITVEGAPLTMVGGNGPLEEWFSIALRPGSGEVWLYAKGRVGPVSASGAWEPQVDVRRQDGGDAKGTAVFVDDETLLVSTERSEGDETTLVMPVADGRAQVEAAIAIDVTTYPGEAPRPMYGFCNADVANGHVYFEACGGGSGVLSLDEGSLVNTQLDGANGKDIRVNFGGTGLAAVNDDGALVTVGATPGEYCLLPWDGESNDVLISRDSRFHGEGYCQGSDGILPTLSDADLHPDSQSWAGMYAGTAILLMDEKKPRDFESDLTGRWCTTVSVNGVMRTMELADDGRLLLSPNDRTEILHPELSWSKRGDRLVFTYAGSDLAERTVFQHWAVRVGDTLHIKSTVDRDSYESLVDSGYTGLSGLWTFCS